MQAGIRVATGYPTRFPVLLLQKRQENIGRRMLAQLLNTLFIQK